MNKEFHKPTFIVKNRKVRKGDYMKKPFFSIIIPAYNSEKHLSDCLNSVLEQTFWDFEILLFDDGSTDQTGGICDAFALNDSRIQVIHQSNHGQFLTRYFGISKSCGKYIFFLDSDDLWEANLLERVSAFIHSSGCDIINFEFCYIDQKGTIIIRKATELAFSSKRIFNKATISEYYGEFLSGKLNSVCTKAFKKDLLLSDVNIDSRARIDMGEDRLFLLYPLARTADVLYTTEQLYKYRSTPESAIHTFKTKYLSDFTFIETQVYDFVSKSYPGNFSLISRFYASYSKTLYSYLANYLTKNANEERKKTYGILDSVHESNLYKKSCNIKDTGGLLTTKQRFFLWLFKNKSYSFLIFISRIWRNHHLESHRPN